MSTKRRNRSHSARSPRARGAERSIAAEGVYNNSPFVSAVAGLIGNVFKVYTVSGKVYEGILTTFSSQFEIAMELPHKVDLDNPHSIDAESVVDKMVFKAQDVVKLKVSNADLDYALKESFQTDTAISKFNGQVQEKELEPWDGPTSGSIEDDFDLSGTTSNGWNVNEMFRQNEQKYGVTSTFDQGLAGYTTPLQKDAKDYKDAEAKAIKIAKEIESNPHYKTRIELENGDEEEKFASVVRPGSTSSGSGDSNTRYVCPPRRKTIQSSNKGPRPPSSLPTQPQQQSVGSLSPKGSSPSSTGYNQQTSEPNANTSSIRSDRANGSAESPKPQRLNVAPRHNRGFTNNDGPKHSHNGGGPTSAVTSGISNPPSSQMTGSKNTETPSQPQPGPPSGREVDNKAGATAVQQHTTQHSHHSHYSSHVVHSLPTNAPSGPLQMTKAPSGNIGVNEGQPHGPRKPLVQPPVAANEHPANPQHLNNQRKKSRGKDEQMADLKKFSKDFKLETSEEPSNKVSGAESLAMTPAPPVPPAVAKSNTPPSPQEEAPKPFKSKLNPNAKEFNPSPKPFAARTASTPNQSRPHTPQTPGFGPPLPPMPMVMPAYVVTTAQPSFSQPPNQAARYRKLQVGMSANPQVASVTGQPLLAPAPLPQFTVPYSPQAHVPPQPYQQMVRMVAQTSGAPPMLTTITYPPDGSGQGQVPYAAPPPQAPPHPPHYPPHVHQHQPPHNNASSPQQGGKNSQMGGNNNMGSASTGGGTNHNGGGGGHNNTGGPPPSHSQAGYPTSTGAASYSQQSLPGPPHAFPTTIMYPIFQAPPPYPTAQPPHHLMTAQQSVQQYVHHQHSHQHSSGVGSPQPHHIQVLLPHNH